MSTTESGVLRELEVFATQARMAQFVVRANVEGVTHEESLVSPRSGGACLNWVLGHLMEVYESALALLGQEAVMGNEAVKRYARGTPPLMDAAEAVRFEKLVAAFDEASERFAAGLSGLTAEVLDRPAPASPTGNPDETVRSLLGVICFHQAYHAGQTGLLRRVVGKAGAIR